MNIIEYIHKIRFEFIRDTGKEPTVLFIHGEPAIQLHNYFKDLQIDEYKPFKNPIPTEILGMEIISTNYMSDDYVALGVRYQFNI